MNFAALRAKVVADAKSLETSLEFADTMREVLAFFEKNPHLVKQLPATSLPFKEFGLYGEREMRERERERERERQERETGERERSEGERENEKETTETALLWQTGAVPP